MSHTLTTHQWKLLEKKAPLECKGRAKVVNFSRARVCVCAGEFSLGLFYSTEMMLMARQRKIYGYFPEDVCAMPLQCAMTSILLFLVDHSPINHEGVNVHDTT